MAQDKKKPQGPPTYNIKPPPDKTKGRQAVITRWLNNHAVMKKYWSYIAKWAPHYGVDPLMFAAMLYGESGGDPEAVSKTRKGYGIAQINLSAHPDVSQAEAFDPAFAIKWAARFFGQKLADAGGDYNRAYSGKGGYNPGGPNIFQGNVPKGYVPPTGTFTPGEAAQNRVEASQATEALTHAQFNAEWKHINDIFYLYTGKNATHKQAKFLIGHGYSDNTLARGLTKTKAFFKSPIWKAHAPDYIEVAKTIFGDQLPPGLKLRGLVRQAITNNWDQTAFASKLREKPQYFKSNEFKKGATTLENSYRAIYGAPDEKAKLAIREATLGRWNTDQWEKYLRDQPEYYNSNEFRNRQYSIMARLGFLGVQTQNPNQPGGSDYIPNSKRIPGDPNG